MTINMRELYHLPWSHRDNGLSWLEITNQCDLVCHGCYRKKDSERKSLEQIEEELEVFKAHRSVDCMSIAGGEPLTHPDIVEVVELVHRYGYRPVINTNGRRLTRDLLERLKAAGLSAVTFHVDSSQERNDLADTSFESVTRLKDRFADMVRDVGGLGCNFNHTVSETTLHEVPQVAAWARSRAEDVDSVIFVAYRDTGILGDFDFYANGEKLTDHLELTETPSREWTGTEKVTVRDIFERLKEDDPEIVPAACLAGEADPSNLKWLFAIRMVHDGEPVGYLSPKMMKVAQVATYFLFGKWLSFLPKALLKTPKSAVGLLAAIDGESRKALLRLPRTLLKRPLNVLRPVKMQTIIMIQPMDVLEDGQFDMCQGCPDMTVHEGKLVRSCRLEELKRWGALMTAKPRNAEAVVAGSKGQMYPYHAVLKCVPGGKAAEK